MALQLPEPEYYTLAEVAERWKRSEDVLLRLGAEGHVLMGYPLLCQVAYVVRPTQKESCVGFEGLSTEMLRAIGIEPDNIEGAEEGYDNIVRFPVGGVAACNWEIGIAIANRRDSFRLNFITGFTLCHASDSAPTPAPSLPYAHHYALCREVLTVSFTDLVIPTTEVYRIEGKGGFAQAPAGQSGRPGSAAKQNAYAYYGDVNRQIEIARDLQTRGVAINPDMMIDELVRLSEERFPGSDTSTTTWKKPENFTITPIYKALGIKQERTSKRLKGAANVERSPVCHLFQK
ncbi:hypothetical protein Acife_1039 [Acidithiobacillus ferrivorans SS3]|uniref:Uncharacterized protein n=2 Tax=Acidithiobacillus ferrivorans TaxID=160808 RepID=G0JNH7_9PROT|nr:hypothetical protein Acife_1039 [Acidithiobacillus ferrivorans SS3]OFA17511.1 hypothetical protein A4U49_01595 [Acidithiobacillus ferrivorans]